MFATAFSDTQLQTTESTVQVHIATLRGPIPCHCGCDQSPSYQAFEYGYTALPLKSQAESLERTSRWDAGSGQYSMI